MKQSFLLVTEDGEEKCVHYEIVRTDGERSYGICAFIEGEETEAETALGRFYTLDEAKAVMNMLCKNKVTPCTLCDII